MQVLRASFAIISWVFLGMVVVQVFFAGVGLFGAGDMTTHVGFGYLVVLVPLLVLIAAALARAGGRLIGLAALLLLITFLNRPWRTPARTPHSLPPFIRSTRSPLPGSGW